MKEVWKEMKGNGAYIQLKMHKDIVQVSTRTNLIKLEALYVGFAFHRTLDTPCVQISILGFYIRLFFFYNFPGC